MNMKIRAILKYISIIIVTLLVNGCFILKDCDEQSLPNKDIQSEEEKQKEKELRWTREL